MANDAMNQHWLETYNSLIGLSIESFKFLALANGGAAIAILAYLGNVQVNGVAPPDMRYSMAAFLAGLTACGLAMLFAYITQLRLLNEIGRSGNILFSHSIPLWCAITFFTCSLLAFGVGHGRR